MTGEGSLFEYFLVSSLQRALPFAQVFDISVLIAQNLDFNVTGVDNELFDIDGRIVKCGFCSFLTGFESVSQTYPPHEQHAFRVRHRRHWL
jgi:hypothetical protein